MSKIKMKQILAAQWDGATGRTYSVLGLSVSGDVYRYDPKCEAWVPWPMDVAGCREQHKGKR